MSQQTDKQTRKLYVPQHWNLLHHCRTSREAVPCVLFSDNKTGHTDMWKQLETQ